MARKATGKPTGRPKKELAESEEKFWDEFDRMVSYGCTQLDLADWFHCSVDTLDNRCRERNGEALSEVFAKRRSIGKSRIRKSQFEIMEKLGNASMAIFLGKHLLGQSENVDKELMEAIQANQLTFAEVITLVRNYATERDDKRASMPLKTYEQFCIDASYPKPYPKQVEMKDFIISQIGAHMLLGARKYGKTDYCTILGVAYDIYVRRHLARWLIITKSKDRNSAILGEIAKALKANGVDLEIENTTALRLPNIIGKDHSVSAVTLKSVSMRGRHPTGTIMDDPVTEDDDSEATRKLVKKKYSEIYKLCPNIGIIGQPVHKFDLYADLKPLIKTLMVPHGSIKELDDDLEAQLAAGITPESISASYHLKVISEGTTPFDAIKYIDKFPTQGTSVAWIDPAFKGTGKDTTSLSIIKSHFDGVAVFGMTYKKAWNHCLDEIIPLLVKFGVKMLAIECNSLGDQPVILVRQLLKEKGLSIGVQGKDSILNKHSKIMSAGVFAHLIHLSKESGSDYTKQVIHYEYGSAPDDGPDSLASCLEWLGLIRGKR